MQETMEFTATTPLMLRRIKEVPKVEVTSMSMTVVTTQGNTPEMHDQQDDSSRYDKD